jgi:cell division protein FtsQ
VSGPDAPDGGAAPPAPRPRWRRIARRAGAGAVLLAALTGWWWAPPLLGTLAFFHVRRVEFEGVRHTAPEALLRALAVDTMASVWDPLPPLAERVRTHPMILEAEVRRRLPGTLVVVVLERTPVAFLPGPGGLDAVDATGERLPLDPAGSTIDVPVVDRADTALLALLDRIRQGAPPLWSRLSAAALEADGSARLDLEGVTLRAPTDVPMTRLGDIFPVEADLARRRLRAAELDVRFRDQVIVRLP